MFLAVFLGGVGVVEAERWSNMIGKEPNIPEILVFC
jgi:hypothetical protein